MEGSPTIFHKGHQVNGRLVERLIIVVLILMLVVNRRECDTPAEKADGSLLIQQGDEAIHVTVPAPPPEPKISKPKQDPNHFYNVARMTSTDKVTKHSYDVAYEKYLSPFLEKGEIKMLEIGLGCDMQYGPGASLKVWLEYFRDVQLELHFMEYNRACAEQWQPKYPNIKFHIGDQANVTDLQRVIDKSGGQFDVIIDDGGHSMKQQIITMEYMIPNALKDGGFFFLEDLVSSYECDWYKRWADYGTNRTVTFIADIVTDMHKSWYYPSGRLPRKNWMYQYILNIDCFRGICVFRKMPPIAERSGSMRSKGIGMN